MTTQSGNVTETGALVTPSRIGKENAARLSPFEAKCVRRGFPLRHVRQYQEDQGVGPWLGVQRRLCAEMGGGVLYVLWGIRGTGKTQIGVNIGCIMLRASNDLPEPQWPRYTLISDMFRAIRGSFRKDSTVSELDVIAEYLKPRLLVIDEAHERGETEFEDRTLTHIIDKRYGAGIDTIIITNLKKEEIAKSLGTSIVSRVHECGDAIECDWPSFRTKAVR